MNLALCSLYWRHLVAKRNSTRVHNYNHHYTKQKITTLNRVVNISMDLSLLTTFCATHTNVPFFLLFFFGGGRDCYE